MTWLEELEEDVRRRESAAEMRQLQIHARPGADAEVARAQALVRRLLDEMNAALLGGRGSVWDAPAAWGIHLWELWWEPTRERGPYLVVTLLRDSRGTPYLKVQGRRLALEDARLERRLQRALRAAFLQPRVYTPRVRVPAGVYDLLRPLPSGVGRAGGGIADLMSDAPPARPDADAPLAGATWARTMRGRRGRRDGHDER